MEGEKWAERAHRYLAERGYLRGIRRLSPGQRVEVIFQGMLEFFESNPIPPVEVSEALDWFLSHRKREEAQALLRLIRRRR